MQSAAIVGLGLVGGSLARDLRAHGVEVLGWDTDTGALASAGAEGVITPMSADLREVEAVDLVVLATPVGVVRQILSVVAAIGGPAAVTDVGSTKRSIMRAAADAGLAERFVGSHPLAGDDRAGWRVSRTGLFEGARVFLTPGDRHHGDAVETVQALWALIGGRPEIIDAGEHDRLMAWVSHAPQAVASCLGLALSDAGLRRERMGPGGLDMTRLAGSSPGLWAEILIDNSQDVSRALRAISARLASLTDALDAGDAASVERALQTARVWSRAHS